jgi:hypothetical protein
MKIKSTLPILTAILLLIISLSSCEEDFNTIGSNIIGDQNINATLDDSQTVIAYSRKLPPVQTNNLPLYQLGVYNDPVYGKSTVNLLAQVVLEENDPSFGDNPVLDSVVLYIPFFSEATVTEENITYKLDSVFGNSPINISMYESNYFLRDFDPNSGFEEPQKYYSNQGPLFESFLGTLIHTIEDYVPSTNDYVINEDEDDEEIIAPGIRVQLPIEYFQTKIIDMEDSEALLNNNNFREYFRGIYFKVEGNNGDNLVLFDIEKASISLKYTFEGEATGDDGGVSSFQGDFKLLFGAINVNVFDNQLNPTVLAGLSNPDYTNGEETLYIRGGGDGIVTIIDLFGVDADQNGVADELELLRQKKWLINEANLKFYVDQDKVTGGSSEPERIVVFDAINGQFLLDFSLDVTATEEPINALNQHLGRLERGNDANGDFYKIKITNHVSNLINKDSTNVSLGLIVSQNVLQSGFQDLENIQAPGIDAVPSSSVISHEGTVLYGNTTSNVDKRLKLEIYYTEPN